MLQEIFLFVTRREVQVQVVSSIKGYGIASDHVALTSLGTSSGRWCQPFWVPLSTGTLWGFGSGVALQLQQEVPQEPLAPYLCLLREHGVGRKEMQTAMWTPWSFVRVVQQDTLSKLRHVEQLAAITQVRQGYRIGKQSPAVFIFGCKVLCLEAE